MAEGLFGTGISALRAFQRQIATTGHNISNANRADYTRQRVELETHTPERVGNDFIGRGVQVAGVERVYDQFLTEQVRSHTASAKEWETFHGLSSRIDSVLADQEVSLAAQMQRFFEAVHGVANDPTSTAARQVLLSEGQSLTDNFRFLSEHLKGVRQGLQEDIGNQVKEINGLAQSIAQVNEAILNAGPDSQPNDLLDQRDELLRKLSEHVSVESVEQDDGTLNVFIGSGQNLVVGTNAASLEAKNAADDPRRVDVFIQGSGSSVNITANINGGQLGGALRFREEVLDRLATRLDNMSAGLVQSFNSQHKLGVDLNGTAGEAFFSPIVETDPTNTGGASVSATVADPNQLRTTDYSLDYDGSTYTLQRASDGQTFDLSSDGFPGNSVTIDGMTLTLTGSMDAGDSFTVNPDAMGASEIQMAISDVNKIAAAAPGGGVGDNRNALELASLQEQKTLDLDDDGSPDASYRDAYGGLVADIGTQARQAELNSDAQDRLLQQAKDERDAISGVNLDEEAANLVRFQQAYQAAAKVITTAETTFQSLLNAFGR